MSDTRPLRAARPPDDRVTALPTRRSGAVQTMLDLPPSTPLEVDRGVPYWLTPAGRVQARAAAPTTTPLPLPALDDADDPRRATARALRRGGLSPSRIARRLGVDELAVRVWVGDARPVRLADGAGETSAGPELATIDPAERAYRAARDAAAAGLGARLTSVAFTRGLSLVAAAGVVDRHAVLVTTADPAVAEQTVRWLVDHAGADRMTVRAVVRLGDRRGGDLAARRWADRLGIDREVVRLVGWVAPPRPDAVEVMVRVADQDVAARVAGWRDALLGMDDPDVDRHRMAF